MTEKEFEDQNLAHRAKSEVVLDKSLPIILMLDGRAFGKFTKQFEAPFDDNFIRFMNETALFLCNNIQNAVFAFVQSDEISIYLKPCEENSEPWFGGRVQKICSVAAGMASAFFTSKYITFNDDYDIKPEGISNFPSFDCRAWNVPNDRALVEWFAYRQKDCIRNSKNQFARHYLSHSQMLNLSCDEAIKLVSTNTDYSWYDLGFDKKFGRLIHKSQYLKVNSDNKFYTRNNWQVSLLKGDYFKSMLND